MPLLRAQVRQLPIAFSSEPGGSLKPTGVSDICEGVGAARVDSHQSSSRRSRSLDAGQARVVSNQPEQILSDISVLHLIPETGLCPPLA